MINFRYLSSLLLVPFAMTITSCSQPEQTQETTQHSHQEMTKTEAKDTDQEYLTTLGLMKGHLLIAKQLIDQGKYAEAEPHIGHPVEELYGDIEGQLTKRKVADFKGTLNQLNDGIKTNPKSDKIKGQYDSSIAAIDQAISAVPADKLQSPETILLVINGLLKTANAEYEAAIANGKIVEVIEYQDSMGFMLYAEQLYQSIAEAMSQKYPEKNEVITTTLQKLKTAWPSVNAPETPVMAPEQVSELVTKINESGKI
ncbi:hypothetical protein VB715_14615 [Crocosphaera sp. UHCC 0190]|uniref:hypothetical protein n=1 Tax=Crocosphaera sp. UHCC 0190 TaxID=3110246 RepID=UPI002B2155D0|nr:hypothetical protein [Crocosphaera sp. UHCC 0190]MEA5511004.1 hypothetical protein [Crocosphaera sp. UHCC 0190]